MEQEVWTLESDGHFPAGYEAVRDCVCLCVRTCPKHGHNLLKQDEAMAPVAESAASIKGIVGFDAVQELIVSVSEERDRHEFCHMSLKGYFYSGYQRKKVSLAEIESIGITKTRSICNPVPRSTPVTLTEISNKASKLLPSRPSIKLELYSIFREIDVKHNGCILPEELRAALQQAGIELSDEELAHFVERIDKDNNGIITFEEWRDFLLLYPHTATMANIYKYWEKVCLVDIGEQAVIPEGISRHVHATKYFIAGGFAGALSRTATAPLDRLKVLLQVQTDSTRGKARLVLCIKQIYKEGGILGFFRGNGLNVLKVAPESAIKFYAYEMIKDFMVEADGLRSKEEIGTMGRLLAGGTAGAIAQTAIYPMDLVKTRLQTYACIDGKAPPLMKLSKDIWQQEGPRAFYRGLLPSLLGMIPYAGIDLAAYETLKNMSRQWLPEKHEPGPLVQLCCGMVSGALGATCVYPLQLVRTRLQAQQMNSATKYRGMMDVFKRTLREEGLRAFYKGLLPNLLKVIPAASITYIAYEKMEDELVLSYSKCLKI
ncbi:hypothetical protein GOP47_0006019 [Adiantum capillus-veneris]|uniref:EF-hand domain-containing protein n=1 Tax=Adiantum capillus-veneris TaxID=13818 RepID=A0A9D4V314_ADICA|nr:hypothetical protein GOP47_0006019 [Adiantum capillus-veneris]